MTQNSSSITKNPTPTNLTRANKQPMKATTPELSAKFAGCWANPWKLFVAPMVRVPHPTPGSCLLVTINPEEGSWKIYWVSAFWDIWHFVYLWGLTGLPLHSEMGIEELEGAFLSPCSQNITVPGRDFLVMMNKASTSRESLAWSLMSLTLLRL